MLLEQILKHTVNKGPRTITAKKPDEDFIPYVCHYDENTILTKNGELLQVIKITGFSDQAISADIISLRDALRDAIYDNVNDSKFSFWFHHR